MSLADTRWRQIFGLIGWIVVTFAASALGAIASVEAGAFYGQLQQPAWAPPAGFFAPVWTALYSMMAIAAWLVWRAGGFTAHRLALTLFLLQLGLNALWSWLFFAWRLGGLAFAEVLLLWSLILLVLVLFWRVRALAGVLLLPYLGWVSFAAILNLTLWRANPLLL